MDAEQQRKRRARLNTLLAVIPASVLAYWRASTFVPNPVWTSAAFNSALVCCAVISCLTLIAAGVLATDESRVRSPSLAPIITFVCLAWVALIPYLFVFDSSVQNGIERQKVAVATMFYGTFCVCLLSIALVAATVQRRNVAGNSPARGRALCYLGIALIIMTVGGGWTVYTLILEGL